MTGYMRGGGTKQNPYEIETIGQLQDINKNLSAHYRLVGDVNANTEEREYKPIGKDYRNPFTGSFDGNGYNITNLSIKQPEREYVGIFGHIGKDGCVKYVNLINATVRSRTNTVGSLVGVNNGEVKSSCVQASDVSGGMNVGGIVSRNYGKIESSYVHGDISGRSSVGGLVGCNRGKIDSSYVDGDVSGYRRIGRLVGVNTGKIESSYAVERDLEGDKQASSLIGYSGQSSQLESCFALSNSDVKNITRSPDLVMSRGKHRILYFVETSTLYIQVNNETYSQSGLSPIKVQSLMDDTKVVEMTDKFMSSVLKGI